MSEQSEQSDERRGMDAELEALRADVARLRKDVGALTEALREAATDYAGEVRERVGRQASSAREKIDEQVDQALGAGKQALGDLEAKVGERPLTSLLTAAGIGFILSRLLDLGRSR